MDPLAIVRGLLAGIAATGLMTLLELVARAGGGFAVLLDWQLNQATVARITERSVEASVGLGLGFHFLHGLVAGAIYVFLVPYVPSGIPWWATGAGYGLVLLAVSLLVYRPVTGQALGSGELGRIALPVGVLTHVVYGVSLALLMMWP